MKNLLLTLVFIFSIEIVLVAQDKGIDSIYITLKKAKDDTSKVNKLVDLSYNYSMVNPDEGIRIGEEALKLAEKLNWKQGVAKANNNIAVNYSNKAEYNKALDYNLRGLKINTQIGDKRGIAKSYSNIGVVYSNLSDFPKALDYYQKALIINNELNDSAGIAGQLNNIGISYDSQSNYPKALEYYFKALNINESIGNKKGIAGTINGIAGIYFQQSDFLKAIEYTQQALKLNQESGNKNWEANNLDNIGYIYSAEKNYAKAEEYYFKALAIHREIGNEFGEASTLCNIGINYQAIADYPKALENNFKSLEMSSRMGDKAGEELNLSNIGLIYYSIAKDTNKVMLNKLFAGNKTTALNKAKDNFDRAIIIAKEIGDLNNWAKNNLYLSDIHSMLGDCKSAFENYKKYTNLNDSIFNLEKDKKLTQTAMQYEFDKKQAEIKSANDLAVQKQKNRTLIYQWSAVFILVFAVIVFLFVRSKQKMEKQQEIEKERYAMRDRLTKEVHDDFGSIATSLINVCETAKSNISDSKIMDIDFINKIRSRANIITESLSDLKWINKPEFYNTQALFARMNYYVTTMIEDTNIKLDINLPFQAPSVNLSPFIIRNILLFFKESINNAVKYSQASILKVDFQIHSNNNFQLIISDNGKGFDINGTHTGMGLRNFKNHASEISNGKTIIESKIGIGTTITLTGTLT